MPEILKPNFNNGLWASGGAIVAPSNVKITTGWTAEVPPFQWENYSQNRQDQGIAHILQHGISVWDSLTEYQAGKSYVQGSDGLLYRAIQTHTNQNPVTDTSFVYWSKALSGGLLNVRVFTGAGTYIPTPGTQSIIVEIQAGGGGGGATTAQNATNVAAATGGGGGGFIRSRLTAGFSGLGYTVGAGGAGGIIGQSGGNGLPGGGSTFGGLTVGGGAGGLTSGGLLPPYILTSNGVGSGSGGSASGGNLLNIVGGFAGDGFAMSSVSCTGGRGGNSFYGPGAPPVVGNVNGASASVLTYGAGGGGSLTPSNGVTRSGGAGAPGIIIVYEYI